MTWIRFGTCSLLGMVAFTACSTGEKETAKDIQPPPKSVAQSVPPGAGFHVDPITAGTITGTVRFIGQKPTRKVIDMSEDPACVTAHRGKATDEALVVGPNGGLANVFVYVKAGLEGKRFEVPAAPAVIDQNGCWFRPRVLGIQTDQTFQVTNSDPVTHNIHPMAQVNREWNHSQGVGDAPLGRKFTRPEVMIRVKCNIHSWMHAYIGVVDNPYFAVSGEAGRFSIGNLPAGDYTLGIWQERLGVQERRVTVAAHGKTKVDITFKGQ